MLTDISNALEFLTQSTADFIRHLPNFFQEAEDLASYLPTFLVPSALTMISVLVVNKLMHNGIGG